MTVGRRKKLDVCRYRGVGCAAPLHGTVLDGGMDPSSARSHLIVACGGLATDARSTLINMVSGVHAADLALAVWL